MTLLTNTPEETLQQIFGFDAFLPGQEAVIAAVLAGRSVLAIFPTGQGKSLCYQLPALHLPGLTLVVSPLMALMKIRWISFSAKELQRPAWILPWILTQSMRCMTGCTVMS